jgi:hypothetical protein
MAVFALTAACSNPVTAPSSLDTAANGPLMVAGAALTWFSAAGCTPDTPLPGITGTAPERTLDAEGNLRGFWPLSEVRTVTRGHTEQDFIIADFVTEGGAWRICAWSRATREQFACTTAYCG